MGDIFVGHAGQQRGPFTEADVLRMVQSGELSRTDLWWKEGMPNWEPLSNLVPAQGPPPIPDQPPAPLPPPPLPAEFPAPKPAGSASPLVWILCICGCGFTLIVIVSLVAAIVIPFLALKARKEAASRDGEATPTVSDSSSASSPVSSEGPSHASAPAAGSASTEGWHDNSLDGLRFKSPFAMQPLEIPLDGEDAEETKKMIASWHSMQGQNEALYVMASVVTYTADAALSLDGAVKGAMEGMATQIHIPLPEYETVKTTVGGLPARRVDTTFDLTLFGRTQVVTIRAVFVESGQRLVQLLTIQFKPGEEEAARARAVIDSATVGEEGAGAEGR